MRSSSTTSVECSTGEQSWTIWLVCHPGQTGGDREVLIEFDKGVRRHIGDLIEFLRSIP